MTHTKLIDRLNKIPVSVADWKTVEETVAAIEALTLRAGEGYSAKIEALIAERDALQAENERMTVERDALALQLTDMRALLQTTQDGRNADVLQLQARLDAMGKGEAVQFLCDATRFKVRQHEGDEAGRIYGLPRGLNGRWVALVAADDDCHLKLAAPKALAPLSREAVKALVAEADYFHASAQSKADFINGIRHGEKAHGIHAKGGHHEDA